jgi:agmatinase
VNNYNPNATGRRNRRLFGIPDKARAVRTVVLPVPWDVTCSYGTGAARAPAAILAASPQLDLWHPRKAEAWRLAPALARTPAGLVRLNGALRPLAAARIAWLEAGAPARRRAAMDRALVRVNAGCATMVRAVRKWSAGQLATGRLVGVLGGDHSTALGLIQAVADRHAAFGILQIDAHMDLRRAYEGFTFSHAAAMHNALQCRQVERLVQVGVRDCCEEEMRCAENSAGRVRVFTDRDVKRLQFDGTPWSAVCARIVDALPEQVYLSVDVDGLDPALCPHTGTPVPGGLSYAEAVCLAERVVDSGRRIVAFDLCEVAPGARGEWDAAVGARLLFELAILMAVSHDAPHTQVKRGRSPLRAALGGKRR